jgi:hypothetical protein
MTGIARENAGAGRWNLHALTGNRDKSDACCIFLSASIGYFSAGHGKKIYIK